MKFDTLEIENFLSVGPKQSLELSGRGLVLIEGENRDDPVATSNGAGKSTIPEALVWCLTGKTMRGVRGDDVVNNRTKKDCRVALSGEKDGSTWRVVRYRKCEGKGGLTFHVAGEDQTAQGEPVETQRRIERHLGASFDTLTNALVFGQGDRWRFTELTDAQRKEVLDKLLGIEQLALARDWVKREMARVAEEQRDARARLTQAKDQLAAHRESVKLVRRQHREWQRQQRKRIAGEIRKIKSGLVAKPEAVTELVARRTAMQDELGFAKARSEGAAKRCESVSGAILAASNEVASLQSVVALRRAHVDTLLGSKPGTVCDACGTPVVATTRDSHLSRARKELQRVEKVLVEKQAALASVEATLKPEKASAAQSASAYERLRDDIREVESRIVEARSRAKAYNDDVARLLSLRKDRSAVLQVTPPGKKSGVKRAKELKATIAELEVVDQAATQSLAHYLFWERGFGPAGVKSYLLDYVVPILNQRSRKYSRHIMGGLSVEFSSQTQLKGGGANERLDVAVSNAHGADVYAGNSGGEKRKIDIVVARTLQSLEADRSGLACDLTWWDEVFESLDESSCEAVMTMLREEAQTRSSVFVISHMDWLKPHFPQVLRVVKVDGFSRFEWG